MSVKDNIGKNVYIIGDHEYAGECGTVVAYEEFNGYTVRLRFDDDRNGLHTHAHGKFLREDRRSYDV